MFLVPKNQVFGGEHLCFSIGLAGAPGVVSLRGAQTASSLAAFREPSRLPELPKLDEAAGVEEMPGFAWYFLKGFFNFVDFVGFSIFSYFFHLVEEVPGFANSGDF